MSADDELDPRENPFHPRLQTRLIGHKDVEDHLLSAYRSGKLHHAWMLTGPQGIGKATLAYRFAKFLFSNPDPTSPALHLAQDLSVGSDSTPAKRVMARGHSDLLVLQRELNPKTKKIRPQISVDDARKTGNFFAKTAGEGGWRICIIDAADEMNTNAANAVLKILEEPPQKCVFLVISHSPGKLLPTIRSRCLKLEMSPLQDDEVKEVLTNGMLETEINDKDLASLITLSHGSPGRAKELASSIGARQFIMFEKLASRSNQFDTSALLKLSEEFSKRGTEEQFNIFNDLLSNWLGEKARLAAMANNTHTANALAKCHADFAESIRQTNALNLDRRQTLMLAFDDIENALI